MRYLNEKNVMQIHASELIALARRNAARVSTRDEDDRIAYAHPTLPSPPTRLCAVYTHGALDWEITADAAVTEQGVVLAFQTEGVGHQPPQALVRQARGEGFLAAYLLSAVSDLVRPTVTILYVNGKGEVTEQSEHPTVEALHRFLDRALLRLETHSAAEIDRVSRRLPSMARVPFPHPDVREGQRELISACYRAIRRGNRLYACAPTGIGKTISTLFPAVRALGEGRCEKIFYLTAKATTAVSAAEAAKQLAGAGADLRVLLLHSRERICQNRLRCREIGEDPCPLSRFAPSREEDAARELLYSGKTVIDSEDLRRIGTERKLCPYELSLRYAMLADIVICDYNYLFDARVALHRFFSEPNPAWCFLIDEAHNLVERSRELYSLSLPLSRLEEFYPIFSKNPRLDQALKRTSEDLRTILAPLVADNTTLRDGVLRGFTSQSEIPRGLPESMLWLQHEAEDVLAERKMPLPEQAELSRAIYDLRDMNCRLALYSSKYISFITREGDALAYRALCLDPAEILADKLSLGGSAILFSATLTPTDYYRTVLGGTSRDECLDLPSPFDPEHLCVAVLDRISTRYHDREESLLAVARAILTAVKAKPGNYMIFCPSFAYLDALSSALGRLAPRLQQVKQDRHMTVSARREFLSHFSEENRTALLGLCVLGGIFGEGIDLTGRRLIGSVVIGVGLPQPTPEREAISAYYEDTLESGREYAYHYPGMNRVLQAAGRVIRREEDRGIILLIDDRLGDPLYREMIPAHWRGLKYVGDLPSLTHLLNCFWGKDKT